MERTQKQLSFRSELDFCIGFLKANHLPIPKIDRNDSIDALGKWYGRRKRICINMKKISKAIRTFRVAEMPDRRSAGGVLAHKIGHFIFDLRKKSLLQCANLALREPGSSSYEPTLLEAICEAFMLFVWNPELLRVGRPKRYDVMTVVLCLKPIETRSWREVIVDPPLHIQQFIQRWIEGNRFND